MSDVNVSETEGPLRKTVWWDDEFQDTLNIREVQRGPTSPE